MDGGRGFVEVGVPVVGGAGLAEAGGFGVDGGRGFDDDDGVGHGVEGGRGLVEVGFGHGVDGGRGLDEEDGLGYGVEGGRGFDDGFGWLGGLGPELEPGLFEEGGFGVEGGRGFPEEDEDDLPLRSTECFDEDLELWWWSPECFEEDLELWSDECFECELRDGGSGGRGLDVDFLPSGERSTARCLFPECGGSLLPERCA